MEFASGLLVGLVAEPLLVFSLFIFLSIVYNIAEWNDRYGWAWISMIALGILAYFSTTPSGAIYSKVLSDVPHALFYLFIYFLIGSAYSLLKFWRFSEYSRRKFSEENKGKEGYHSYPDRLELFLQGMDPRLHTEKFITWIIYWPVSLIGLIISEPLANLAIFIADVTSEQYQAVYNYVFSGMEAELKSLKEKK